MTKREKIQQFHFTAKTAKEAVNKSINTPHGLLARDYSGMHAVSARLSKKQPGPAVNGRRLYDIVLGK